jgi:hypothetical protein
VNAADPPASGSAAPVLIDSDAASPQRMPIGRRYSPLVIGMSFLAFEAAARASVREINRSESETKTSLSQDENVTTMKEKIFAHTIFNFLVLKHV